MCSQYVGPNVGLKGQKAKIYHVDFLGHDKAKLLTTKYDNKTLIPLLMKCNHFLNVHVASTCVLVADDPSYPFFDTPISSLEA
jgi:hypothetical protein